MTRLYYSLKNSTIISLIYSKIPVNFPIKNENLFVFLLKNFPQKCLFISLSSHIFNAKRKEKRNLNKEEKSKTNDINK